ncbi:scarecrow-like protein 28 [Pistacia vera]|uniref:scarecrow-like protein 28 n=1 Tax=Pistacia vera TaxID=55513 RepID=UPI001263B14D|nr:scarecrow-like protein 28 [Pistacia vera]
MLAGCSSSTLVSPRHRLRSEASAQFQACHFQLPSMNTQRLDLPCSFSRKDTSRSQPIRPVGLSVDKPIESKTSSCSLKQNIRLPPLATSNNQREIKDEFWEKGKSLKRFAEGGLVDESCINRAKRKKGSSDNDGKSDDIHGSGDSLSLGQLSSGNFWFQQSFTGQNVPQVPFTLTCSGEDDRVCFVPSDLISPPLPLSNIPWVESIITEITDLGEKDGDETSHRLAKEVSASSISSESHNLALRLHENPGEHDVGNGSKNPYPHQGGVEASEEDKNPGGNQGFELVSLLTACVEAIGTRNIPAINHYIAKLGDLASPRGSSISRLLLRSYTCCKFLDSAPHICVNFYVVRSRKLIHQDEAEDLEEQPLVRHRSRHMSSGSVELPKEAGVIEASSPSSPGQHDISDLPTHNGMHSQMSGVAFLLRSMIAVMLEAAMFGGIPESGYNYP